MLRPDLVMIGAAALAFAGTVAVFALLAMDRPVPHGARAAILMNEDLARKFIYFFRDDEGLQVTARADQSVGEILARFDDLKAPPETMKKPITFTIRNSPKTQFPHQKLLQLFAVLGQYNLDHVVLTNEKGEFVGYIPGKRAKKDFTGEKALNNIDKYILGVLKKPAESAILRELDGATADDTIEDTENSLNAQAKLWRNDKIAGLVVHQRLRPVGFIPKADVFRLNAGLL